MKYRKAVGDMQMYGTYMGYNLRGTTAITKSIPRLIRATGDYSFNTFNGTEEHKENLRR